MVIELTTSDVSDDKHQVTITIITINIHKPNNDIKDNNVFILYCFP